MDVRGLEVAGLVPAIAVVRSIAWPLIGLAPVPDLKNPVSGRPELIAVKRKRGAAMIMLFTRKIASFSPKQIYCNLRSHKKKRGSKSIAMAEHTFL